MVTPDARDLSRRARQQRTWVHRIVGVGRVWDCILLMSGTDRLDTPTGTAVAQRSEAGQGILLGDTEGKSMWVWSSVLLSVFYVGRWMLLRRSPRPLPERKKKEREKKWNMKNEKRVGWVGHHYTWRIHNLPSGFPETHLRNVFYHIHHISSSLNITDRVRSWIVGKVVISHF